MKKGYVVLIACIGLSLSTPLFAYDFNDDSSSGGCSNGQCETCTTCQCTDLGAGRNSCMSMSDYCEAFGNIGAR